MRAATRAKLFAEAEALNEAYRASFPRTGPSQWAEVRALTLSISRVETVCARGVLAPMAIGDMLADEEARRAFAAVHAELDRIAWRWPEYDDIVHDLGMTYFVRQGRVVAGLPTEDWAVLQTTRGYAGGE